MEPTSIGAEPHRLCEAGFELAAHIGTSRFPQLTIGNDTRNGKLIFMADFRSCLTLARGRPTITN